MQDWLLKIQDACLNMPSAQLAIPALVVMFLGLFLWLGGTRYANLVMGLLGGAFGACLGFLFGHWFSLPGPVSVLIGACLLAIIALVIKQAIIILLGMLLFAAFCASTYLSYTNNEQFQTKVAQIRQKASTLTLDQVQSQASDAAEAYLMSSLIIENQGEDSELEQEVKKKGWNKLRSFWAEIKLLASENRGMIVLWAILGGAVGLILAYFLKKIMMLFCCSVVGASAIIAGVVALFFARGTPVFNNLQSQPRLLPTIFIAMIIFGCLVQLLFAGRAKAKTVKVETVKGKKE